MQRFMAGDNRTGGSTVRGVTLEEFLLDESL
jgi:hypothetical protein